MPQGNILLGQIELLQILERKMKGFKYSGFLLIHADSPALALCNWERAPASESQCWGLNVSATPRGKQWATPLPSETVSGSALVLSSRLREPRIQVSHLG